jgi:tetratricopeptide (TPR) repeat protein
MAGITTDPRELATEVFRLEVALAAQLVQVDPNNPDWRYNLAAGNANVGFGLEKQGRFAEALSYYQKSLAITQKLIAEDPKDRSLKVALSFVQNDIVRLNEARARMNPSASAHK